MIQPVGFLHTSAAAIPPLQRMLGLLAPDWEPYHLLDDGILKVILKGAETERLRQRLAEMGSVAVEDYGCRCIVVTCSSVSSLAVERLRQSVSVPVMKVDEAMIEEAVRLGTQIGVLATVPSAIKTTCQALQDEAVRQGRKIRLQTVVRDDAYQALRAGDTVRHDVLLEEEALRVAPNVDVVLFAQVSMSNAAERVRDKVKKPVLSSVRLMIERLRKWMESNP